MPTPWNPMNPLISLPRCSGRTRSTPATSRPSIHPLSAAPAMNNATSSGQNHGVTAPMSTDTPITRGPTVTAGRVPKRSISMPPRGWPRRRPAANAVTVCALMPPEIPNSLAISGMMGNSIP